MFKGKFAVLSLAAAALLCLQVAGVDTANSGNVDPCESSASSPAGVVFACPYGDGDALNVLGLTISVTVKDNVAAPVPGVPATDMWLISCNDLLNLCNGSSAITAAAATDVNGQTTFTGDIAAGGCDNGGVRVVVQGIVIGAGICADACVPVAVRSADFNANGIPTDAQDFGYFTFQYPVNPTVTDQDRCRDFDNNGVVDVVDFAKYTGHYDNNFDILHRCGS
jgi:hypothetical protein